MESSKYPTIEEVEAFSEEIIAECRNQNFSVQEFNDLIAQLQAAWETRQVKLLNQEFI